MRGLQRTRASAPSRSSVWHPGFLIRKNNLSRSHPLSLHVIRQNQATPAPRRFKSRKAAKSASCRYLLTEDLQADQDLGGVLVVNPFLCDPAGLPRA